MYFGNLHRAGLEDWQLKARMTTPQHWVDLPNSSSPMGFSGFFKPLRVRKIRDLISPSHYTVF